MSKDPATKILLTLGLHCFDFKAREGLWEIEPYINPGSETWTINMITIFLAAFSLDSLVGFICVPVCSYTCVTVHMRCDHVWSSIFIAFFFWIMKWNQEEDTPAVGVASVCWSWWSQVVGCLIFRVKPGMYSYRKQRDLIEKQSSRRRQVLDWGSG